MGCRGDFQFICISLVLCSSSGAKDSLPFRGRIHLIRKASYSFLKRSKMSVLMATISTSTGVLSPGRIRNNRMISTGYTHTHTQSHSMHRHHIPHTHHTYTHYTHITHTHCQKGTKLKVILKVAITAGLGDHKQKF